MVFKKKSENKSENNRGIDIDLGINQGKDFDFTGDFFKLVTGGKKRGKQ